MDELELLKQKQEENLVIRSKAATYAKTFLVQKYYTEYKELYNAYLHNRGYTTRGTKNRNLIDEKIGRAHV